MDDQKNERKRKLLTEMEKTDAIEDLKQHRVNKIRGRWHLENKIAGMRNELDENSKCLTGIHKESLPSTLVLARRHLFVFDTEIKSLDVRINEMKESHES